jgi:hypothetical protein
MDRSKAADVALLGRLSHGQLLDLILLADYLQVDALLSVPSP